MRRALSTLLGVTFILCCGAREAMAQQYGWTKIAQPTTSFISAVSFVDSLNGWIGCILADADKSIFRTQDGGYTWQRQVAPLPPNIQSIGFVDILNGWIVGNFSDAFGYIIHTSNGGQTWQEQRRLLYRNYVGLGAHDPLKATVTGGLDSFFTTAGLIVRTSTGGQSWQEQRFLKGIGKADFVDSQRGWAIARTESDSIRFIRTIDGGRTWEIHRFPLEIVRQIRAFDFADLRHGWAIGPGTQGFMEPIVMFTNDAGMTWKKLYEFPFDRTSRTFVDLAFADTLNGWLVGSAIVDGVTQGEIFRTTDGGATWTVEMRNAKIFSTKIFALNSQHAWTGTTQGEIIRYGLITKVDEHDTQAPSSFALLHNYPNPFNPTTTIEYYLQQRTPVVLTVTNLLGKEVRTLVKTVQGPGNFRVLFEAKDLPNGVYYYTLRASGFKETKSMTLLK